MNDELYIACPLCGVPVAPEEIVCRDCRKKPVTFAYNEYLLTLKRLAEAGARLSALEAENAELRAIIALLTDTE